MGEPFKKNWKKLTGVRPTPPVNVSDLIRLADQGLITTNATGLVGFPINSTTPSVGDSLIWNGMQYVPVATSGVSSGAGGGVGATVGGSGTTEIPSPDFASIGEAVVAGFKVVHVINDTIESTDITLASSGLVVTMYNDATVHMLANSFVLTGTERHTVQGHGEIRGTAEIFSNCDNLLIRDFSLINPNSAGTSPLIDININGSIEATNLNITTVGANRHVIRVARGSTCVITKCTTFGSATAGDLIQTLGGNTNIIIDNCIFNGEVGCIDSAADDTNVIAISNLLFADSPGEFQIPPNSVVNNVYGRVNDGAPLSARNVITRGAKISNFDAGSQVTLSFNTAREFHNCYFDNVAVTGVGVTINGRGNAFSNCRLGVGSNPVFIRGAFHQFSNCLFGSDVSALIEASGCTFVGCQFASAVTFKAESSGNIILGSRGGLLTDSGTANVTGLYIGT